MLARLLPDESPSGAIIHAREYVVSGGRAVVSTPRASAQSRRSRATGRTAAYRPIPGVKFHRTAARPSSAAPGSVRPKKRALAAALPREDIDFETGELVKLETSGVSGGVVVDGGSRKHPSRHICSVTSNSLPRLTGRQASVSAANSGQTARLSPNSTLAARVSRETALIPWCAP